MRRLLEQAHSQGARSRAAEETSGLHLLRGSRPFRGGEAEPPIWPPGPESRGCLCFQEGKAFSAGAGTGVQPGESPWGAERAQTAEALGCSDTNSDPEQVTSPHVLHLPSKVTNECLPRKVVRNTG